MTLNRAQRTTSFLNTQASAALDNGSSRRLTFGRSFSRSRVCLRFGPWFKGRINVDSSISKYSGYESGSTSTTAVFVRLPRTRKPSGSRLQIPLALPYFPRFADFVDQKLYYLHECRLEPLGDSLCLGQTTGASTSREPPRSRVGHQHPLAKRS